MTVAIIESNAINIGIQKYFVRGMIERDLAQLHYMYFRYFTFISTLIWMISTTRWRICIPTFQCISIKKWFHIQSSYLVDHFVASLHPAYVIGSENVSWICNCHLINAQSQKKKSHHHLTEHRKNLQDLS